MPPAGQPPGEQPAAAAAEQLAEEALWAGDAGGWNDNLEEAVRAQLSSGTSMDLRAELGLLSVHSGSGLPPSPGTRTRDS